MRTLLILSLLLAGLPAGAAPTPAGDVHVEDSGPQRETSHAKGHEGHAWEKRSVTMDSGAAQYRFQYSACVDPSHGDARPSSEGALGMPGPSAANWYHGGFLFLTINGKEVTGFRLTDLGVIETGVRGAFQMVWDHPDATVGLRLLMPAGANHVLAHLAWKPKAGAEIKSVSLRLDCYPSFFTAWHHRQGDRHVASPRIDRREGQPFELAPAEDTYLYYYDTVFDTAREECEGPCALLFDPRSVEAGRVQIGGYAVQSIFTLKPAAGEARLAFYDFHGQTNADAAAYLKAHGADDRRQLETLDFRPPAVQALDAGKLKAELEGLLAAAGDDAKPFRPRVSALLEKVAALKPRADAGDWQAEAELATALAESNDLVWKLRIAALLAG